MQRVCATILLLLAALVPGPLARAHDSATTVFAAVTVDGAMVRFRLTLSSLPDGAFFAPMQRGDSRAPATYAPLADAIGRHVKVFSETSQCRAGRQYVEPPTPIAASFSTTVDYVCPGPVRDLVLVNDLFDVVGRDLHMIARVEGGEGAPTFSFGPDSRRMSVAFAAGPAPGAHDNGIFLIAAAVAGALGAAALVLAIRRRG